MYSKKSINSKVIRRSSTVNHNALKSKSSQHQIINQDDKFDYRKNIAAIERIRAPELDSKSHPEANNISG
jgi:hypothetical protein